MVGLLTAGPGGMIAGPLAGGAASQGNILVEVQSKPSEARDAFRLAYPNDKEVSESLLQVRPRQRK